MLCHFCLVDALIALTADLDGRATDRQFTMMIV